MFCIASFCLYSLLYLLKLALIVPEKRLPINNPRRTARPQSDSRDRVLQLNGDGTETDTRAACASHLFLGTQNFSSDWLETNRDRVTDLLSRYSITHSVATMKSSSAAESEASNSKATILQHSNLQTQDVLELPATSRPNTDFSASACPETDAKEARTNPEVFTPNSENLSTPQLQNNNIDISIASADAQQIQDMHSAAVYALAAELVDKSHRSRQPLANIHIRQVESSDLSLSTALDTHEQSHNSIAVVARALDLSTGPSETGNADLQLDGKRTSSRIKAAAASAAASQTSTSTSPDQSSRSKISVRTNSLKRKAASCESNPVLNVNNAHVVNKNNSTHSHQSLGQTQGHKKVRAAAVQHEQTSLHKKSQ